VGRTGKRGLVRIKCGRFEDCPYIWPSFLEETQFDILPLAHHPLSTRLENSEEILFGFPYGNVGIELAERDRIHHYPFPFDTWFGSSQVNLTVLGLECCGLDLSSESCDAVLVIFAKIVFVNKGPYSPGPFIESVGADGHPRLVKTELGVLVN
jgi:hypothetical protein